MDLILIGLLIVVQGGHTHGIQGNHGKVRGNNCDEKVREKSGKIIKNCQSKGRVRENETVLQMSSEKMLISRVLFLCFFCQQMRFEHFTFQNSADKFESGKNILSHGKVRENENLK